MRAHPTLGELLAFFLRLGATAFGGPAAHIAMMQEQVVEKRGWLTRQEFLDLLGVTNLIPGPNSTEMAIHIGYRLRGWAGLILAGVSFILPAFLLVWALAWAYQRYGELPEVAAMFVTVRPVIVVVVVQAIVSLAPVALGSSFCRWLGALAALLALCKVDELPLLFGCGAIGALHGWRRISPAQRPPRRRLALLLMVATAVALSPALLNAIWIQGPVPFGLTPLFLFFLKVGAVLYGSGYVLLSFLNTGLVENWHWLTQDQLLNAVAVGQFTPGPVFTTATFVGYLLAGPAGAALATLGIFLPSFFFVALSGPLLTKLSGSNLMRGFLDGVNASALALMAVVTLQLGRSALIDPLTWMVAALSAVLLLRYKVNSAWLILGAAATGVLWR